MLINLHLQLRARARIEISYLENWGASEAASLAWLKPCFGFESVRSWLPRADTGEAM